MSLILELVSPGGEPAPSATRKVFGPAGGTIGRAKHSDWVLPDKKVSSRHARISYEGSVFYIEDTSTNGIYLNSPDERLESGRLYALQTGDRLFIEPYEMLASISNDHDETRLRPVLSASDPGADDPFGLSLSVAETPLRSTPAPSGRWREDGPQLQGDEVLDPLKLLDPRPTPPPRRNTPAARDLEGGSRMDGHYQPPPIAPAPPAAPPAALPAILIPDNYNPLEATGVHPMAVLEPQVPLGGGQSVGVSSLLDPTPASHHAERAPTAPAGVGSPPQTLSGTSAPEQRSEPSPADPTGGTGDRARPATMSAGSRETHPSADLAGVLAAAGLTNVAVSAELATKFGDILRVVVEGVMDVLRSRHEVKDEFRMRMTYFRPVDNNPLKFSANADDALHNLLVKRNEAYLGPVEAFQDAFEDLRNHQLAMLAGMRVAFEATLAEFDADRLQEQFDRQLGKKSLLPMPGKLRYWDAFREHGAELARDPESTFRRLFGEAFTQAYESQLKRLKDK